MKLQEKYNHIKFLLSDESLQLLPEYQQRVEVGTAKLQIPEGGGEIGGGGDWQR